MGLLTGYVYVDPGAEDAGVIASGCPPRWRSRVEMPEGYTIAWSGQYEAAERLRQRLLVIVPLTLALIVLLIRVNTKSWVKTGIVMLAVPFSLVGAIWTLYLLGYHLSTAVWVGMIALMGVDAQTGVFMLLYLDLAYENARRTGRLRSLDDLRRVILEGAAMRIRPKFMTVTTMMIGLLADLLVHGPGSDLMKRIAAPMAGGMTSSFLMELLIYPVLYLIWRQREIVTASVVATPGAIAAGVVGISSDKAAANSFVGRGVPDKDAREPGCCAANLREEWTIGSRGTNAMQLLDGDLPGLVVSLPCFGSSRAGGARVPAGDSQSVGRTPS